MTKGSVIGTEDDMGSRPRHAEAAGPPERDIVLTVPNAMCVGRMIAAVVLVVLAWWGLQWAFFWLLVAMLASDWLDGKIARWLDQRSAIGPRLDSIADVGMYVALVIGLWWLHHEAMLAAVWLIGAVVASYAVLVTAAAARFGRWATYHTRMAKTSWLLIGAGVVVLFAVGPAWPFYVGLGAVVVTNVEALVITFMLREYRDDVPSVLHVRR